MSDFGKEARSLLEGGRHGDDPTPADRARIRASVMRALAGGAALGAAATAAEATAAAKTATGLSLLWKLGGLAVLCAASAGTTVAVMERAAPPDPPRPARAAAPLAAPPASAKPAPPAPPFAEPPPPATAAPAPRATATAGRPEPADLPADAPPPPPPSAAPVPAPPPDTLAAETQRLREAHGALRGGDAQRALALLEEQADAGAQLREERAAGRILALCELGRVEEARAQAAAFLQQSPQSPMADRVRRSCAGR